MHITFYEKALPARLNSILFIHKHDFRLYDKNEFSFIVQDANGKWLTDFVCFGCGTLIKNGFFFILPTDDADRFYGSDNDCSEDPPSYGLCTDRRVVSTIMREILSLKGKDGEDYNKAMERVRDFFSGKHPDKLMTNIEAVEFSDSVRNLCRNPKVKARPYVFLNEERMNSYLRR